MNRGLEMWRRALAAGFKTQKAWAAYSGVSEDTIVKIKSNRRVKPTTLQLVEVMLEKAERGRDQPRQTRTGLSGLPSEVVHAPASGVLTVNARAFAEIEALTQRLVILVLNAKHVEPDREVGPDRQAPTAQHAVSRKAPGAGR